MAAQALTLRQFAAVKMLEWSGLSKQLQLSTVESRGGFWPWIRESFIGAWQQNTEVVLTDVLTYAAVYRCVAMISQDIGKLRIKLVELDREGIWTETESPSFSPVLNEPNRYQTRQQFLEHWIISKLVHGNTYVLKQRDNRKVVNGLYILDPQRVQVLVAPDGAIYYEVKRDDLSSQPQERILAPASEVIHDRNAAFYHPLVGISPISACGLAAMQGLRIQDNSAVFFENGSQPGGFITAAGAIPQATAARLKAYFDTNFSGANRGKVAVGGDGLTYTPLSPMSSTDAQLIEQLKWTAENVCMAFGVPPHKIGIGNAPAYGNYAPVKQDYHETCLQTHIESIENLLDKGLGLSGKKIDGRILGTELDTDTLLRMDTPTRVKAGADAIGSGGVSPNEARKRFFDLGAVEGGQTPYLQQQNYSLAALNKRDISDDPFGTKKATPAAPAPALAAPIAEPADEDRDERFIAALMTKAAEAGLYASA